MLSIRLLTISLVVVNSLLIHGPLDYFMLSVSHYYSDISITVI